jgi:NTP pyrophosphatase (non-canonical NTP hydrolase)
MESKTNSSQIEVLTIEFRQFVDSRDWGQFHSPRNLVLALVGEVGELAAEFQWTDDVEVPGMLVDDGFRKSVGSELADVFGYLLRLADVLQIDLADELRKKIAINEVRYPADKSRGSSDKYTSYE